MHFTQDFCSLSSSINYQQQIKKIQQTEKKTKWNSKKIPS